MPKRSTGLFFVFCTILALACSSEDTSSGGKVEDAAIADGSIASDTSSPDEDAAKTDAPKTDSATAPDGTVADGASAPDGGAADGSISIDSGQPDTTPQSPCQNLIQDGDETDVDCGGSCSEKCALGKSCVANQDCRSQRCNSTSSICEPSSLCQMQTEIPELECAALEALFVATDGSNWTNKNGWRVTSTPCTWFGIACSSGHISQISMYSNNVSGPIPPEIGNLLNLESLSLPANQVSSIPPEIGNLSMLREVLLPGNRISSVPAEIKKLSNLRWLYLHENQIRVLPPEIGNLPKLELLYVYRNQLSSIPAEIGNLGNLHSLFISYNQLTDFPPEIGRLSSLRELVLNENQITSMVTTTINAQNLPNLDHIDFCPQTGAMGADANTDAFLVSIDKSDWNAGVSC